MDICIFLSMFINLARCIYHVSLYLAELNFEDTQMRANVEQKEMFFRAEIYLPRTPGI